MSSTSERSPRRCALRILVLTCCLVPLADLAVAGQAQEASIIGQVTDESGAVLPGVTVTATSPALQVPQVTDVTNDRGEYRLTPLPIGTYTVQYELAGFGTVRRQDIRLTAGFTARVDVALKVGALQETVTVSGAAPVVDVTSSATRTQLTRETLELIPTSRTGIQSVMVQAPGVRTNLDFGEFSTGNPAFRAFGQSHESWTTVDGMVTSSPKSASPGSGNHYDYSVFEETTVQTIGSSAEAPTRGIQLNVILKPGGDDFHGGGYWGQSSQRLQSNNLDDALRAQGIRTGNPVDERWDVSGELGGRIVRNKLWFYSAARARTDNSVVVEAFKPDGSPAIEPRREVFSTIKVSYQISPSHKLFGFYQNMIRKSESVINQFTDWGSRQLATAGPDTSKLEWQFAKGNKFVSLQYGVWLYYVKRDPASDEVGTFDEVTLRVTGRNDQAPTLQTEGRKHAKGTLNWYKPDLLWGNHDFKAGFDYSADQYSDRRTSDRGAAQNYRLIFRNGAPFQLEAHNHPVDPHNPVDYLGTYLQDSWTIARRLTLNLGVRYAHENGALPEQCRVAAPPPLDTLYPAQCFPQVQFKKWNSVVPRLHATYDLTGDGNTVVKGGWGRFAHMRYVDEILIANENVHLVTFLRWHDLKDNKQFDPGEVNFDRNGPDFLFTRLQAGESFAGAVPNPNEKQPTTDEFSLSVERQLIPNLAVRMTGVYSRNRNTYRIQNNLRPYEVYTIPITNPDPGPDGRLGTADDPGTFVTYGDYPAALAGRAFQQPMLINDSRADADFKSVEVEASKRLANRWMFMASYSATKLHIPYVSNISGIFNPQATTFDPNAEINAANTNWEWLGRLSGAYLFPADVQVSANFEHRSGDPWAREVSFTGGRQIPSIRLRVEPVGTRRLPNVNILNLRAEKSFRVREGQRLSLRLNVYNAMNVNTVLSVTPLSGRSFLRPRTILPPRIAEFAVQYTF